MEDSQFNFVSMGEARLVARRQKAIITSLKKENEELRSEISKLKKELDVLKERKLKNPS